MIQTKENGLIKRSHYNWFYYCLDERDNVFLRQDPSPIGEPCSLAIYFKNYQVFEIGFTASLLEGFASVYLYQAQETKTVKLQNTLIHWENLE